MNAVQRHKAESREERRRLNPFSDAPLILKVDAHGRPVRWLRWETAATIYARENVLWSGGNTAYILHGGINRISGRKSILELSSIIAVRGHNPVDPNRFAPPLSNRALFHRDRHLCMYCGTRHSDSQLTRDHIVPMSLGGADTWQNSVSCCKTCNSKKANHPTPEAAGMKLLAVPYAPSLVEYLILSNRKILADQMDFLAKHVPKERRERILGVAVN